MTSSTGSPDNNTAALRSVAEQLASEAAAFVRRRRGEVFGAPGSGAAQAAVQAVRSKSTPTDPVTVVDTETERLLRERLATLRPGDPILGEEGGGPVHTGVAGADSGAVTWVLDPIDGTVNFVYGIPAYAVSVAAQLNGVSVAGAVADVIAGEIYSGGVGLGAHVQGPAGRQTLQCTSVDDLSMTLLGTGFGYSPARRAAQAALLARVLPVVRDVRRIGSASLDLCMVAAGRLDAYYEHGTKVWDWGAGAVIAAEAGALVRLPPSSADILVAAAPGVFAELTELLDRFGGLSPLPE